MPTPLQDFFTHHALPFTPDAPPSLHTALDTLLAQLNPQVDLLALGEPLHNSPTFLNLRNQVFHHLAQSHGYTAIVLESSFPRAHLVNAYVTHSAQPPFDTYDAIQHQGFSHNFGPHPATRALIDWMRQENTTLPPKDHLRFYGADAPTEMMYTDSPRQLLTFALTYLAPHDPTPLADQRNNHFNALIADDAQWTNPAAMMDPAQSIGRSEPATALRLATEDLITTLEIRRPDLIPATSPDAFEEALHHATLARQLLTYHAALARPAPDRTSRLLAIRDVMIAHNLAYAADRERRRGGKLFAHAHNTHLQRGPAHWQLGPDLLTWHPAGAHLPHLLGPRFANIGAALAASPEQGISPPEPHTLESLLSQSPGPARFLPTPTPSPAPDFPPRARSTINPTYFPLTPQSLTDFDYLVALDSAS